MEASPDQPRAVSAHDVVSAVLEQTPAGEGAPEKIVVMRVHDELYVCRIYEPSGEYVGFQVALQLNSE